ncbi:hypothetical protein D9758_015758 [Tetrapyrgos nigripes]|uniref:Heterokaryon incompatibility domain-containing protein n=1 Tax=Tetrapyrgos nigripes TaxID=182062 RepID=A0A8H5CBM6_9AGAR|nr:hypothetical protein D9758_015758 [Tetrapyrgos nigripes]
MPVLSKSESNHSSISAPSSSAARVIGIPLPADSDPLHKRARPGRLIDAHTLRLVQFPSDNLVPPYAILSHRWLEGQEVSYWEMLQIFIDEMHPSRSKAGFQKIVNACAQALKDGHTFIWTDTCCIDDGDHAQKSQDINSMYNYYSNAEVCYVFLSDFPWPRNPSQDIHISESVWFSRGWTLQEFVAPSRIKFFTADWEHYRIDRYDLVPWGIIASKTGIPTEVLAGERRVEDIGIKERMSWSINRETTKEEDQAYCLLGLLGVTMELRYGEGAESAFAHLSRLLYEQYPDQMVEFLGLGKVGDGKAIMNILRDTNRTVCDTTRREWMRIDKNLDMARAESHCQLNPSFGIHSRTGRGRRPNGSTFGRRRVGHLRERERVLF